MLSSEKMQWFAMRATYRRGMQIKALLDKEGINNFIPMRYEVRIRNGRKRRELVPVISDLIFVHSVQSELQKVKFKLPYFQYMIDIRNGQKIIVPDDQMRQFIAVPSTFSMMQPAFTSVFFWVKGLCFMISLIFNPAPSYDSS